MIMIETLNCIILCGGAGSRMGSAGTHKVCYDIHGKPAINRAIENYKKAGVGKFILVVGHMCGQVIETVGSEYPDVFFVYQHNPGGTGHAARIGLQAMRNANIQGPVLLTMGDKIVQPAVVQRLAADFERDAAAVTFAVAPKEYADNAGRVVTHDGVTAIREVADIKDAMQYHSDGASESGKALYVGDKLLDPFELEESVEYVNSSVYLFRQSPLARALKQLNSDNAQSEEYLTDVIEIISAEEDVSSVPCMEKDAIMSFNNPEELLEIRDYYRDAKKKLPTDPAQVKDLREWLGLFDTLPADFYDYLSRIYGDDSDFIGERTSKIKDVLKLFMRQYGPDRKVLIARAPGRINLMGRHIDHRGGNVNVMSINRETVMVASAREDDRIRIANTDDAFEPFEFSISEHVEDISWDSWEDYVNSDKTRRIVRQNAGSWVNYIKAAALRLQHEFSDMKLRGMDVAVTGDIPIAAGLSSSSAIVVAAVEAMVGLNELEVSVNGFVDLCGEGEWFVGSRGGSADHAAMKFAERGQVISMSFFPFEILSKSRFPEGYRLIIANSGIKAEKSDAARNQFNHRVACYELGMLLLKQSYRVEHLRDMTPENLSIPLDSIYKNLLEIPQSLSRKVMYDFFHKKHHPEIARIMSNHEGVKSYPLRAVILYGISECARARLCRELLQKGDIETLGRLMVISHEGDRVAEWNGDQYVEAGFQVDDEYLQSLIANIESEEANLENQPGSYFCSTPEIDFIVDTACSIQGVCGAQLSGAGLGGCAMILAESNSTENVKNALIESYYQPRSISPDITICNPVHGSGILQYE